MPLVADWSVATRWTVAVAGAVVFLATAFAMAGLGRVMKANGYGIVAFEKAPDDVRSQTILDAWGERGRAAARASLWADFAFVVAYVTVPLVVAGTSEAVLRDHDWTWWPRVAAGSGWAFVVAGVLDVVENSLLLRTLATGSPSWRPRVARPAATLKFWLAGLALPVLATAGIAAIAAP